jgi:DNA modification methylase
MNDPLTIGDCTLYLQDADIEIGAYEAEALITDPPYGVGESGKKNASRKQRTTPTDYGDFDWDSIAVEPYLLQSFMDRSEKAIIWGGNYFGLPAASKWLVWDKENSGDFADCELAWTNLKGAVRIFRHMWNGMLRASERGYPRVHQTQKPIALMDWCLVQADSPKSVIDPFMGSGTTGVSCAKAGVKFIGIERDPRYFKAAVERITAAYAQYKLFV